MKRDKLQAPTSQMIPHFSSQPRFDHLSVEENIEVVVIKSPEVAIKQSIQLDELFPRKPSRRGTVDSFNINLDEKKKTSIGSSDPAPNQEIQDLNEKDQIAWLRGHSGHAPRKSQQLEVMGSDEDPREYDRTRQLFNNGLIVMEVAGLMSCFLLIFWIFQFAGGQPFFGSMSKPINLHVILMVVFMFYLHGHAALIYRIFPHKPKYTVKLMHAGLHLIVCIATAVGLAAAVQHHNINNVKHFFSFHSWLGLTAIIVYYGQFLGGFVAFLLPTTPVPIRALVLPIHRVFGQTAFSLSTGAIVTGVMLKAIGTLNDYSTLPTAGLVINFGGFFALLFSIAVGSLISDHRFRRRPRPEGELLLADATE